MSYPSWFTFPSCLWVKDMTLLFTQHLAASMRYMHVFVSSHTHAQTYIYICVYVCMCVCVWYICIHKTHIQRQCYKIANQSNCQQKYTIHPANTSPSFLPPWGYLFCSVLNRNTWSHFEACGYKIKLFFFFFFFF